jgi:CheY-like chemotaxis protein
VIAAAAAAEILDAVRGYVWIALAAAIVWKLFPVLRRRIESEDFTVEIAGQKVSFANASIQSQRELDDLRERVIALTERLDGAPAEEVTEAAAPAVVPAAAARILWVDDHPENNAFLIKSLEDRGAQVTEATSTDQALEQFETSPTGFDVVISDMGRMEHGKSRPLAGVELVRRVRRARAGVPVVIYAAPEAVARGGAEARDAGAAATTASPTELLTILRIGPTTAFEAEVAEKIRRHVDVRPFPIYRSVDFVAQNGERVGIEIKNWPRQPSREEFERALARVRDAHDQFGFDRIVMITRRGVGVPKGIDLPSWVTLTTEDELEEALRLRSP